MVVLGLERAPESPRRLLKLKVLAHPAVSEAVAAMGPETLHP